ncbi:hypothetical protein EDC04DRAFT_777712 [Pisolithus marmoratus]|nr:hypothetical protein EDC04DRAFT_777712 [Pisolithus marmoratus]
MPADRRQTSGAKERLKQSFFLYLLGAPSLKALHVISQKQDQKEYSEIIKDLTERTNNVNVIAALVIASSAVYVAAGPPTDISTWDPQFPYFCMLASYGGGMLAIIAGFAQIIFLSIMGPGDINVSMALSCSMFSLILVAPVLQPTTIGGRHKQTQICGPFHVANTATLPPAYCSTTCWRWMDWGCLAR